jgi:hypothetical protein
MRANTGQHKCTGCPCEREVHCGRPSWATVTNVPTDRDERPDRPERSSRSVRGHLPPMTENRFARMNPTVPMCRGWSLPVSGTLQTILPNRNSELYGQMVTNSSPVGTNVPTCLRSSGLRAPIVRSRGDVRPRYADGRPPRCRRPGPAPTNRGCMGQDAVCRALWCFHLRSPNWTCPE